MKQLIVMLFTAASGILNMQTTAPNSNEPYRIVAGDISMLQSKLDEAAGAGYRLILANSAEKGQVALLLERAPGGELYAYKVLSTIRTSTMQKEIDQNATDGYRIVPRSLRETNSGLLLILERPPQSASSPKYKLLAAQTGIMQRKVVQGIQDFSMCCATSGGELIVIMQKASLTDATTTNLTPAYMLTKEQPSAMEKEMNDKAASGYHLVPGTPATALDFGPRGMAMFMEKDSSSAGPFSYRLLEASKWLPEGKAATLEKELNVAAFEGYRPVPGTVAEKQKAAKGGVFGRAIRDSLTPYVINETIDRLTPSEILAVMGRGAESSARYEDVVRLASDHEMFQAVQDGYKPVEMTLMVNTILVPASTLFIIMERKVS